MSSSHKRKAYDKKAETTADAEPLRVKPKLITPPDTIAEAAFMNPFQFVAEQQREYANTVNENAKLRKEIHDRKAQHTNLDNAYQALLSMNRNVENENLDLKLHNSIALAEKAELEKRIRALEEKLLQATKGSPAIAVTTESPSLVGASLLASFSVVAHQSIPPTATTSNVAKPVAILKPPSN